MEAWTTHSPCWKLSFHWEGMERISFTHTFIVVTQLEQQLGHQLQLYIQQWTAGPPHQWLRGQILESLSEGPLFYEVCTSSCRLCLHTAAVALVDAGRVIDITVNTNVCWWPCADSAVSWFCELIGSCKLNSLWSLALWGDFHTPLSQHAFFLSLACCVLVALPSSRLTVTHRKRDFYDIPF